jgi:hypothetical protein
MYSYYVTTLVGIANTTMDAFMGTVLYQCKTQLRILRYRLSTLCVCFDPIKVYATPILPLSMVMGDFNTIASMECNGK